MEAQKTTRKRTPPEGSIGAGDYDREVPYESPRTLFWRRADLSAGPGK
jgi:hypothetical protein